MQLEIIQENGKAEIFETYERSVIVGRGRDADCHVQGKGISREHLRLEIRGSEVYVTDLGSSNGTYIQERKLEPNKTQSWPSLFPIRMGAHITITLLPDNEILDSTLVKVYNPLIQKEAKKGPSPAPSPLPPDPHHTPRSSSYFSTSKILVVITLILVIVGALYFNPPFLTKIFSRLGDLL